MFLRSVWSKTLRSYRTPILCWGIGLALFVLATLATYETQVKDPAARATLAQLVQSFRFYGEPIAVQTATGYTTWRLLNVFVPVILSIWALLAGSALIRSEEERGSSDLLLATPISRARLLLEKYAALVGALIIIGIIIALGIVAGEASGNATVNFGRALLAGLNISLITLFFASFALLLSQFLRSRGAAAGITGGLLGLSVLVEGAGRTLENANWLSYLSPLYYYSINKPLIDGYEGKPWTALVLLALIVICAGGSVLLFRGRDIGAGALTLWQSAKRRKTQQQLLHQAQNEPANRSVGLQALRAMSASSFWWLVGVAVYTTFFTLIIPSVLKPLRELVGTNSVLKNLYGGQNIATNAGFLAFLVFQLATVIVVIFVLTQAARWAAELDRGQLELVLATPLTRIRILLERFGALLLLALLAPILIWLTVVLAAQAINLNVDAGNVAIAAFSILPLELLILTFVFTLAERIPAGTIVGIGSAYIALAFLAEMLHSLLNLPDWLLSLSIFHLYGTPIKDGWNWSASLGMLGVALALLLLGMLQFRQSDIERSR